MHIVGEAHHCASHHAHAHAHAHATHHARLLVEGTDVLWTIEILLAVLELIESLNNEIDYSNPYQRPSSAAGSASELQAPGRAAGLA